MYNVQETKVLSNSLRHPAPSYTTILPFWRTQISMSFSDRTGEHCPSQLHLPIAFNLKPLIGHLLTLAVATCADS